MLRREFIAGLGGATAWPAISWPQSSGLPTIGFLSSRALADFTLGVATFREALAESDFVDGRNIAIEYRWADGDIKRLPALAAELARRRVAVIYTTGGMTPALAAKAATQTIPIVYFSGGDPVRIGLVASVNRPGGNVTGVSNFSEMTEAKRLDMLHQLLPKAHVFVALANPDNFETAPGMRDEADGALKLGLELHVLNAGSEQEIEAAFARMTELHAEALFVQADPFFGYRTDQIVKLAARYAIPAAYPFRSYPNAGGFMFYGAEVREAFRQSAYYVARILKGAKPADLPILGPTKTEFIINLRTARALGVVVPPAILALTDAVIE
jgi:putative tryptophan/tyrosine transport system substrate-binding protein